MQALISPYPPVIPDSHDPLTLRDVGKVSSRRSIVIIVRNRRPGRTLVKTLVSGTCQTECKLSRGNDVYRKSRT